MELVGVEPTSGDLPPSKPVSPRVHVPAGRPCPCRRDCLSVYCAVDHMNKVIRNPRFPRLSAQMGQRKEAPPTCRDGGTVIDVTPIQGPCRRNPLTRAAVKVSWGSSGPYGSRTRPAAAPFGLRWSGSWGPWVSVWELSPSAKPVPLPTQRRVAARPVRRNESSSANVPTRSLSAKTDSGKHRIELPSGRSGTSGSARKSYERSYLCDRLSSRFRESMFPIEPFETVPVRTPSQSFCTP